VRESEPGKNRQMRCAIKQNIQARRASQALSKQSYRKTITSDKSVRHELIAQRIEL
jgi:hypothetical protein